MSRMEQSRPLATMSNSAAGILVASVLMDVTIPRTNLSCSLVGDQRMKCNQVNRPSVEDMWYMGGQRCNRDNGFRVDKQNRAHQQTA